MDQTHSLPEDLWKIATNKMVTLQACAERVIINRNSEGLIRRGNETRVSSPFGEIFFCFRSE
jgi:hypothetical protein